MGFTQNNKHGKGRPKSPAGFKEACREWSYDALHVLTVVLHDENATYSQRMKAAEMLLDRGYGKPKQEADLNVTSNPLENATALILGKKEEKE